MVEKKIAHQLALEIQKICWLEARKFETSDLEIALLTSKVGRPKIRRFDEWLRY
jgi:hypothetical protein